MSIKDDVYRLVDVDPTIRSYVSEDASDIADMLSSEGYNLTFKVSTITAKLNMETDEEVTNAEIIFEDKEQGLHDVFPMEYITLPNGKIYMEGDIQEQAESLKTRLENPEVYSSTNINKRRNIFAADIEDDEEFDEPTPGEFVDDSDGFEDTLDDVADTVDDMQDQLDDIDTDDVDIEMDNNISNHYIAECDRCHGLFISAVIESDQEIDKISGTCPLCDKETEQQLKWIIRDVNSKSKSNY